MYHIGINDRAQNDLDQLPDDVWLKILDVFKSLRLNPILPESTLLPDGRTYRIKVNGVKIIYDVDNNDHSIEILRVK